MEQTVQLFNLGAVGVITDVPGHLLPPEAFTSALNMQFTKKGARTSFGRRQVFGTPTMAPGFIFCVPSGTNTFWVYTNKTKAAVYDNGVHTNITRQSAGVDVNYTAVELRDWQGTILGGVPIFNNGADVPQFWATLSSGQKLQNLTNWPSNLRAKVVRAFGRWIFSLNITEGGTNYPHVVRWSHSADPGTLPTSYDITDPAVDASQLELTDVDGGIILDAMMLGNVLVVYKQTSTHVIRLTQGANMFSPDLILAGSGIFAPRCVRPIKKGMQHFVLTEDDVIIHSGQKDAVSVADERIKDFLFNDIDPTNKYNTFVINNEQRSEALICYPSQGNTYPDKAAIFAYERGVWRFDSFEGISADYGLVSTNSFPVWSAITQTWDEMTQPWSENDGRGVVSASFENNRFIQADVTDVWDPAGATPYIERLGLAMIGRDRQGQPKVDYRVVKIVHRMWPKITGQGQVDIRIGVQDSTHDDVVWGETRRFDPSTMKYVDFDPRPGRLISYRLESADDAPWQLEGLDMDMSLLGNI